MRIALDEFRAQKGFGRAIAAPQVGHLIRAVTLNLGEGNFTIFNPEITQRSDERIALWDDCMSLSGGEMMVRVKRHKQISLQYVDEAGEISVWDHMDVALSELIQHELDHLDGILAVDLAEAPPNGNVTGIISRSDFEKDREFYESLVDYTIEPTL